jgi:uncharacterized membrane protein YphA (DoxX/SURF4 family)
MLNLFDLQTAANLIETLVGITAMLNAVEMLADRQQYDVNGIFSYAIHKTSSAWMIKGWQATVLGIVFEYPRYLFVVTLELLAAILLISHLLTPLSWLFVVILLLTRLLSHLRNGYGLDGADQMQIIVLASLTIFHLSPAPLVKLCSMLFICFQALLAYFTAGVVKLRSSIWRDGTAISNILQTNRFRNDTGVRILKKHPQLAQSLCWSVIVFECTFPLLVVTGTRTCFIALVAGVLFHFSVALVMGLNSFFWSFVATYPAILFFANMFQQGVVSHFK